jgi:hypothetical protein
MNNSKHKYLHVHIFFISFIQTFKMYIGGSKCLARGYPNQHLVTSSRTKPMLVYNPLTIVWRALPLVPWYEGQF